ncbi:hypothetical protein F511_26337 [Dorcoceras hygrometricum]|uniref:Uncharacterized protein n=1 Tax=Dorcoceras hygrometricum TaxID=472368 RepID=A0A2Z7ABF2_9LAMI|nr:hypothetical protein F511_26337 [Dorcoceras hygrometricum]
MASESVVKVDMELLTASVTSLLDTLPVDPSNSYTACIYRVSEKPRKANEAAYTPRLVSIGPLHRDKSQLHGMESYKMRCLQNFYVRFGIELKELLGFVAREESSVRGCYEDTISLSKEKLSEMILLDGVFIVEIFLKNHFFQFRERSDTIFENRWIWNDLLHDLMLLENQLPMNVAKGLLRFVDPSFMDELTFYDLAHEFFKNVGNTEKLPLTEHCCKARHFVEFLLFLHQPRHWRDQPLSPTTKFEYTHSATELKQAGVEFCCGNGSMLFDVRFRNGELKIPSLLVNDSTETFFRNIIAFEQCSYHSRDITSYVIFMDGLINTREDVVLLVNCGAIRNELGEDEAVADLFNNLHKEIMTDVSDFYFAELCVDVNEYSRDFFHELKARCFKWGRVLRHDYFSNPWAVISVIAAGLLLGLKIIQAVCSIIQVKH